MLSSGQKPFWVMGHAAIFPQRRLPIGAEVVPGGGVHFRVWAPGRRRVEVVLKGGGSVDLRAEGNGYHSGRVAGAAAGALYAFRLDGEEPLAADPASRFQPAGPHGPSQVIDPAAYRWTDAGWKGIRLPGQVFYEMHVGTFTIEGTYAAAAAHLEELRDLGVTALELMPLAEFPGRFNWGYDGVDLYAPAHVYGEPDELRRFVDLAHSFGLGVILDVVYNHAGPDGSPLKRFSPDYFTPRCDNEWGEAVNFDGKNSEAVREFIIENAGYWIAEFHFDGLRLDATQSICDASPEHVLAAVARRARAAAGGRDILLVAENEPQDARLLCPPEQGGCGLDALWNDDFHHAALVALGGRREAYHSDYRGSPQEFVSSAKYGYLYQGQFYGWQGKRRGRPTFGIAPARFIDYLENHDQVANSAFGARAHLLGGPGRLKALTALLLLSPATPLLFQGQEFAAASPFLFFADHADGLADRVYQGRKDFLAQFPSLKLPEVQAILPRPDAPETFQRSKLDFEDRRRNAHLYELHRDLLRLRREDAGFRAPVGVDGAVLSPECFVLRYFADDHADDRLLVVNLGRDLRFGSAPEPLLAPPEERRWHKLWSTEEPRYGGAGCPAVEGGGRWMVPGHAAVVLKAEIPSAQELAEEERQEKAGDE